MKAYFKGWYMGEIIEIEEIETPKRTIIWIRTPSGAKTAIRDVRNNPNSNWKIK